MQSGDNIGFRQCGATNAPLVIFVHEFFYWQTYLPVCFFELTLHSYLMGVEKIGLVTPTPGLANVLETRVAGVLKSDKI